MQFLVQNHQWKQLIKSSNSLLAHANLTSKWKNTLFRFWECNILPEISKVFQRVLYFLSQNGVSDAAQTIPWSVCATSSNPTKAAYTTMTRKEKGMGCTHQFVSKFLQTSWEVSKYTLCPEKFIKSCYGYGYFHLKACLSTSVNYNKDFFFQWREQSNIMVFKSTDSIFTHYLVKLKYQTKKILKIK